MDVSKTLSHNVRVLNCIRELHTRGLIFDGPIKLSNFKDGFKANNLQRTYGITSYSLLYSMKLLNIIAFSHKDDTFAFKPAKLELILANQDYYITQTSNKYIVTQSLAFKEPKTKAVICCDICKKKFGSAPSLLQHRKSKHVEDVLKIVRNAKLVDHKDCTLVIEYQKNMMNKPELIQKTESRFTIALTIKNVSGAEAVIFENSVVVNTSLGRFINFGLAKETVIGSKSELKFDLHLNFPRKCCYYTPMGIVYRMQSTGEKRFFSKLFTFDLTAKELEHLYPTKSYVKPRQVISDMDESIIPGQKLSFTSDFQPAHHLKSYSLSKDYIDIFNAGLKFHKLKGKCVNLLVKVKQLMDVPVPLDCLTPKNYTNMLELLLFLEEHQMQIDIRYYDTTTNNIRHTRGNFYTLQVPDLAENRPSLIVGDSVFIKEQGAQKKYEGIVHEKHLEDVLLGLHNNFSKIFIAKKEFEISFGYNRTTLKLEHQAARLASNAAPYFFPKTLPNPSTATAPTTNLKWFNRRLEDNIYQQQAVRRIVEGCGSTMPYLIFGPPGTGKSMTVVEAILQIRRLKPNDNILVCAPSNDAANLLASRLLSHGTSMVSNSMMLRYLSFSCSLQSLPDRIKSYCNIKNGQVVHPSLSTVLSYKLVIATLATAGRLYNVGVTPEHFQYLFVDESGHATETETLIPISIMIKGNSVCGQVVLAGDPEQLGPIIHSTMSKTYGYGRSMLERLMKTIQAYQRNDDRYDDRVLTKLLKNYRSHPEIISISNEEFYYNEVIPIGNDFSNCALGHEVLPNKKFPMIFHSVIGTDQREANSPSFFNIAEIGVVANYLIRLIGSKMQGRTVTENDIAVITPYRKQVQKLRKHCATIRAINESKLLIGSVEQLQGQEKLIVIISTVRSKPEYVGHDMKFHLGFLKNPKRFNVALTRAIALLIVVGNPLLLKHDVYWHKYISKCSLNNALAGTSFSFGVGSGSNSDGDGSGSDGDGDDSLLDNFEELRIEDDISFERGQQ